MWKVSSYENAIEERIVVSEKSARRIRSMMRITLEVAR